MQADNDSFLLHQAIDQNQAIILSVEIVKDLIRTTDKRAEELLDQILMSAMTTYGPFEHRCVLQRGHEGDHRCFYRKVIGAHPPESPTFISDLT